MKLMPIEDQQDLQQRLANCRDVEEANKQLIDLLVKWLTGGDIPIKTFFKVFQAGGHRGEYHEIQAIPPGNVPN